MYSAILSRGLAETIADMDVAAATLIAAHGYCSQEVVNLLLVSSPPHTHSTHARIPRYHVRSKLGGACHSGCCGRASVLSAAPHTRACDTTHVNALENFAAPPPSRLLPHASPLFCADRQGCLERLRRQDRGGAHSFAGALSLAALLAPLRRNLARQEPSEVNPSEGLPQGSLTGTVPPHPPLPAEQVMDTPLKGLERQSTIGYLTLIEALNEGYLTVGEHFKQPELPIFVVRQTHQHMSLAWARVRGCARAVVAGRDRVDTCCTAESALPSRPFRRRPPPPPHTYLSHTHIHTHTDTHTATRRLVG